MTRPRNPLVSALIALELLVVVLLVAVWVTPHREVPAGVEVRAEVAP